MEGRNVGTIRGKRPKQGLISDKDLLIELPEKSIVIQSYNFANKIVKINSQLSNVA